MLCLCPLCHSGSPVKRCLLPDGEKKGLKAQNGHHTPLLLIIITSSSSSSSSSSTNTSEAHPLASVLGMYRVCAWAEKLPLCAVIIVRVISFFLFLFFFFYFKKWRPVREAWELSPLYKAITIPPDLTGARASHRSSSSTTRPEAWTGLWRMPCARGY